MCCGPPNGKYDLRDWPKPQSHTLLLASPKRAPAYKSNHREGHHHPRSGGPVSLPFSIVDSSSSHPSIHPSQFLGSKAGPTFRLARISIGSGVKPRASQRCRNNCFPTPEMENGTPANFSVSRDPPPWCVWGRGGWRAISRPQTILQYYGVSYKNDGVLNCWTHPRRRS
jgi:hypothetical protein